MSTREAFEWPAWRKTVLALLCLVVAISWSAAIVATREMTDKLLSLLALAGAGVLCLAVPVPMRAVFEGDSLWLYYGVGRSAQVSPEDIRMVRSGLGFGGRAYITGGVTILLASGRFFWIQNHFRDYEVLVERLRAFAGRGKHVTPGR